MRIFISLFFYFIATPSFGASVVYTSVKDTDSGKVKLVMSQDGKFTIEGQFLDQPGEEPGAGGPPFTFLGTYTEVDGAYELHFESVESPGVSKVTDITKKALSDLIAGSPDLQYLSKGKVRMQKSVKDLRFYGISMEKLDETKTPKRSSKKINKSPR